MTMVDRAWWQPTWTRISVALSISLVPVVANAAGLWIVYTPSVPMGFYHRVPLENRTLLRGDYVCLEGWRSTAPERLRLAAYLGIVPKSWIAGEALTKKVVGLPHERVDYIPSEDGGTIAINGRELPQSTIRDLCNEDRCLPRVPYPVRLSVDEFWISSEHPDGFDSRYFGPVRRDVLNCRAEPLWTW